MAINKKERKNIDCQQIFFNITTKAYYSFI